MFTDHESTHRQSPQSRRLAVAVSIATHAVMGSVLIWLLSLPRSFASLDQLPRASRANLVWLASPGPGGGGGGGGNRTKIAAPAQQVGRDRLTVPIPPKPAPVEKPQEPPPVQPVTVPAMPMAAATETTPGVIDPAPPTSATQGPGSEGGAGSGAGAGSGEGQGSGLGPGVGGGTGGGAYRPGNGVSSPRLVREVKPNYTADAMRAKIQGVAMLECVVLPDGTVGAVKIINSIDTLHGLDEEAIKAAKQWRFSPGLRFGAPVAVLVKIELTFTLR